MLKGYRPMFKYQKIFRLSCEEKEFFQVFCAIIARNGGCLKSPGLRSMMSMKSIQTHLQKSGLVKKPAKYFPANHEAVKSISTTLNI
jgi:hypothetical protein